MEPQAFDVLVYLVRHRDRVVSKDELMDQVWGGRFVTETAVTSRIKQIRRAVGDDGESQRVIRTLHGRGYRFVAAGAEVTAPSDLVSAAYVVGPELGEPLEPVRYTRQRWVEHRLPGKRRRGHRHRAGVRLRLPPGAGLG